LWSAHAKPEQFLSSGAIARLAALAGALLYFVKWVPNAGIAVFAGGVVASVALWFVCPVKEAREGADVEVIELIAWVWMALAISKILI
jgi:hypothetical protein